MPKLTDPGEMELVRKMYFNPPTIGGEPPVDPIEANERMEHRAAANQNQAR